MEKQKYKSFKEREAERLEQKRKENRATITAMTDEEFEILKRMVAEETAFRIMDNPKRTGEN